MMERPTPAPEITGILETRHFETLGALLEAMRSPGLPQHNHDKHKFKCDEWNGFATLEIATAMLGGAGAPDIADKVRRIAVSMAPKSQPTPALAEAYDVSGGAVDVQRFLSGDPECMIDYSSPRGTVATRDVYVNISASAMVASDYIIRRGAAICAVIDMLETARVRVRLHWALGDRCRNTDNVLAATGLLKDYHAPLDLDLVAFAFAHPAMFRQIGFHLMRQSPAMRHTINNGYGLPVDIAVPPGAIYVPTMLGSSVETWEYDSAGILAYIEGLFEKGE